MKKYYIIEFGGKKEIEEMKALELKNYMEALRWIEESIKSDKDYFDIDIKCKIRGIDYQFAGSDLSFWAEALVYVEYEPIVNDEMIRSEIYSIEDIITRDLSVISKIKKKLIEK